MSRRDATFFGMFLLALTAVFAPLLAHPSLTVGNFGDIYSYHYPLRHMAAATLQAGRIPLWNPYIFAGVPFAANPQALLFYPPAMLHYFLPLAFSFSLDAFGHLAMAALGAHLLLRKWKLGPAGAFTLSTAYALSPFLVYRMAQGVPTHLAALSWAPWIWLCALEGTPTLLASAFALQILSGHPQFAIINAAALGLFTLLRRPAWTPGLLQAGSLALILTAAQSVPTLEYLGRSVRAHWAGAFSLGYSLKPAYLLTLLHPSLLGDPLRKDFLLFPSEFFEMFGLYLGVVPLLLAGLSLAPARDRSRPASAPYSRGAGSALLAVGCLGLFLALGQNNPAYGLAQKALRLDFLRVPARFSFLILWALWLAAARGWESAVRRRPAIWKLLLAALTLADLGLWSAKWVYAQDPREFLSSNPEVVALLRQAPRIATAPDIVAPNKGMLYRLRNATGYEAFYPAPIALYTARSERAPAADGSRTYIRRWDTPEMSALAVRYYLSPEPVPGREPVFQKGSAFVYENRAASPLVRGPGTGEEERPEHWTLRMDAAEPLTLSQAFYPGWKAWSGGRRIPMGIESAFFPRIAPPVDAGPPPWTIHLRFLPDSWIFGLLLSVTACAMYAWLGIRRLLGEEAAST